MKILSIDSENTKSTENICFHLDRSPTRYEKEKITTKNFYGSLTIEFKESNIILKSVNHPIDSETIKNLNHKMSEVALDEKNETNKHNKMIACIAKTTNLPFY